jgi:hypothetical protein
MVEEFKEIKITLIRNDEWLEVLQKRGFYLSEEFPLLTLKLPFGFARMEEKDINKLIIYLKAELFKTLLEEDK